MSDGSQPGPNAVELNDVVKTYAGNVRALNGVDLQIASGEYVAITGPSGCGKTTMLSLVGALDMPSSGTISVGGRDLRSIRDLSNFRRRDAGLVFQLHNLIPEQSVIANVGAVMFGTGLRPAQRQERALDLLRQVGLQGLEHRLPTELSGGERQRVAIARALANSPKLLLADEPTGSLDDDAIKLVLDLFQRVHASGVTIMLVTHDAEVAASAHRTVEMRSGRIERVRDKKESQTESGGSPRRGKPGDGKHARPHRQRIICERRSGRGAIVTTWSFV